MEFNDDKKKLRDQQYTAPIATNAEEQEKDESDEEIQQSMAGPSQGQQKVEDTPELVHKGKNNDVAKLEDFEIVRIVGKGTFGKVF